MKALLDALNEVKGVTPPTVPLKTTFPTVPTAARECAPSTVPSDRSRPVRATSSVKVRFKGNDWLLVVVTSPPRLAELAETLVAVISVPTAVVSTLGPLITPA